jgi:hypothetical protein
MTGKSMKYREVTLYEVLEFAEDRTIKAKSGDKYVEVIEFDDGSEIRSTQVLDDDYDTPSVIGVMLEIGEPKYHFQGHYILEILGDKVMLPSEACTKAGELGHIKLAHTFLDNLAYLTGNKLVSYSMDGRIGSSLAGDPYGVSPVVVLAVLRALSTGAKSGDELKRAGCGTENEIEFAMRWLTAKEIASLTEGSIYSRSDRQYFSLTGK